MPPTAVLVVINQATFKGASHFYKDPKGLSVPFFPLVPPVVPLCSPEGPLHQQGPITISAQILKWCVSFFLLAALCTCLILFQ